MTGRWPIPAPRLAVVVTAYNYGHFLSACLDSVLDQTAPVDEIVVIDDGSTDATPDVLRPYADRVRIVRTENGGQAAAFNRGFGETTADMVLFLDADDILLPHAAETIRLHWADDIAHLVFGLEIIDAGGASLGTHPGLHLPPAADNRPALLATGTFPFPPTSGNVFSRRMLDAALPMPEARWRISADCYLIRAAALWGRTVHVPRVLAGYRMHFANNYARLGPGGWERGLQLSNRTDLADALDDLSEAPESLLGPDAPVLRGMLRTRADAIRAGETRDMAPPNAAQAEVLRSRYLPVLRTDMSYDLTGRSGASPGCLVLSDRTEIDLRLPLSTGPLSVDLDLDPDESTTFEVFADGALAARLDPGETRATISLPRRPFDSDPRIRIALVPAAGAPPRLLSLCVTAGGDRSHAPMIPEGAAQPAWPGLAPGLEPGAWVGATDGSVALTTGHGSIRMSAPGHGAALLSIHLGPFPPQGWLSVDADDLPAFRGWTGAASRLDLAVDVPEGGELTLSFAFHPGDTDAPLRIEAVALVLEDAAQAGLPPRINIGEQVAFAAHPRAAALLHDGWSYDGLSAEVAAPEAQIAFRAPAGGRELTLVMSLALLVPMPPDRKAMIGVSRGGEMLAVAHLAGDGEFPVPLGDVPADPMQRLTLHAVIAGEAEAQQAPVELVSFRLDGRLPGTGRSPARPLRRTPGFQRILDEAAALIDADATPAGEAALLTCRAALCALVAASDISLALLLTGRENHLAALVRLGEATRHAPATDAEARHLEAASDDATDKGRIVAALLALLLRPAYRHPAGGDLSAYPVPLRTSPEALARYLGTAPVLATAEDHAAYRAYLARLLASIHAAFADGPENGRLYGLAAAALRRLRAVRTIFAGGNLRDLVRAQSGAIERFLSDGGAPLALPRAIRPGLDRLRLGVLVRDIDATPEGWALRGMYAGLDPARFDPVLIRIAQDGAPSPDIFSETLSLAGMPVPAAVQAIRALDLDVFVTGAYARDLETVSAIYAHRLAPLQVWHTAVCPTTGGFASFDVALTSRASEPEGAQDQYAEKLVWIDGPKQCAYAFDPLPHEDRAAVRAELGVGADAVLMISAALAHKIDDALLRHWAAILDAAPRARLALAPFAQNWSMAHDPPAFETRIVAAGLPAERVILLPALPPSRMQGLLAAADLMLDSFPYTGATTVCEALAAGTPVLTRAGSALRQLTGASWVRAYGLDALVAESDAAYVATAIRLARDPGALAALRDRTEAAAASDPPPHDDRAGFGRVFSDALWRAAEESGLFPDLGAETDAAFLPSRSPERARSPFARVRARTLAILASPRTGSTLLCAVLNRTPGVVCHFELFHEEMIQYARQTVTDPGEIAARNADPMGFLARIRAEAGAAGTDLVGFKHFAHLNDSVTDGIIRDESIRLIHLSRANLLAQFSSEMIARSSGKWVRHDGQGVEDVRIPFVAKEFEKFETYYRRVETDRLHRLARSGRTVLFVEYATLDTPETRRRIGDFIGIPIPDTARTDTRKQNRREITDRFANPDEVRDYLARRSLLHWAEDS